MKYLKVSATNKGLSITKCVVLQTSSIINMWYLLFFPFPSFFSYSLANSFAPYSLVPLLICFLAHLLPCSITFLLVMLTGHFNLTNHGKIPVPCKTVGDSGLPCVFPFIYDNSTYNSCTSKDSDNGQPWSVLLTRCCKMCAEHLTLYSFHV